VKFQHNLKSVAALLVIQRILPRVFSRSYPNALLWRPLTELHQDTGGYRTVIDAPDDYRYVALFQIEGGSKANGVKNRIFISHLMTRCRPSWFWPEVNILTTQQLRGRILHRFAKFQRNRATYGWVINNLAIFLSICKGRISQILRGSGQNCIKFGEDRAPSLLHQTRHFDANKLLCFEMRAAQRWVVSKIEGKFCIFDPCKS